MPNVVEVLARYKEATRKSFLAFLRRAPPSQVQIPASAEEALRLGILIGRQEGYGEGLIEGTKLGLDVGQDVLEAVLSQPVICGTVGHA